jgi:hypothetical protein
MLPVDPATGRRARLCYVSRTNGTWFVLAAALAGGRDAVEAAQQAAVRLEGFGSDDDDDDDDDDDGDWPMGCGYPSGGMRQVGQSKKQQQQQQQEERKEKEKQQKVKLYLTATKDFNGKVEFLEKVKALWRFK